MKQTKRSIAAWGAVFLLLLSIITVGCGKPSYRDPETTERPKATESTSQTGSTTSTTPSDNVKDDEPMFVADHVTARAGETGVEFTVCLKNDPGLMGMGFTVVFDDEVMTMQKTKRNGDYAAECGFNFMPSGEVTDGKCNFLWYQNEASEPSEKGGVVLVVKFDIDADAPAGEYPISLVAFPGGDNTADGKTPVEIHMISGSVTIIP